MSRPGRGPRQLETALPERRREVAEPRLAKWLAPWLVGGIVLLATTYLDGRDDERGSRQAAPVERQVAKLSAALVSSAAELLSHDRVAELDELLGVVLEQDEAFAAFVLGRSGRVVAGGAVDPSCLPGKLPLQLTAEAMAGRVECGKRVYWSATPLGPGNGWLVVGKEEDGRGRGVWGAMHRQPLLVAALVVVMTSALALSQRVAAAAVDRREGV
jgi:hypothetical protein